MCVCMNLRKSIYKNFLFIVYTYIHGSCEILLTIDVKSFLVIEKCHVAN